MDIIPSCRPILCNFKQNVLKKSLKIFFQINSIVFKIDKFFKIIFKKKIRKFKNKKF